MWNGIFSFYGVDNLEELLDQESHQLYDSLQDAFCSECGNYFGQLEPDGRGARCEFCNQPAVCSLAELLTF